MWLGDTPIAVIEAGVTPTISYIHPDHLNRPIALTDATGAFVNETTWVAFGGIHVMTGSVALDLRFPGQWYQHEGGLHYNWNRSYDPTIARYTQPDPLGLVDGPSRYAYVGSDPLQKVDPSGLAEPPRNAWDPLGPKAPGYPGSYPYLRGDFQWPGDPKGGPNWVPNPQPGRGGSSFGWEDRFGNVWCPTGQGEISHGGPHWDIQHKNGDYGNAYPPKKEDPLPTLQPLPAPPWYLIFLIGLGTILVFS